MTHSSTKRQFLVGQEGNAQFITGGTSPSGRHMKRHADLSRRGYDAENSHQMVLSIPKPGTARRQRCWQENERTGFGEVRDMLEERWLVTDCHFIMMSRKGSLRW